MFVVVVLLIFLKKMRAQAEKLDQTKASRISNQKDIDAKEAFISNSNNNNEDEFAKLFLESFDVPNSDLSNKGKTDQLGSYIISY